MDNIIGNNGEVQFANGQSSRDLRVGSDANESETQLQCEICSSPHLRAIHWKPCAEIPTKFSSAGSNCPMGLEESPAFRVEVHGTAA